jgi:hypothetical protein
MFLFEKGEIISYLPMIGNNGTLENSAEIFILAIPEYRVVCKSISHTKGFVQDNLSFLILLYLKFY